MTSVYLITEDLNKSMTSFTEFFLLNGLPQVPNPTDNSLW